MTDKTPQILLILSTTVINYELGLLGKMAATSCLFKPYRNEIIGNVGFCYLNLTLYPSSKIGWIRIVKM
jgi:hypothetical protein